MKIIPLITTVSLLLGTISLEANKHSIQFAREVELTAEKHIQEVMHSDLLNNLIALKAFKQLNDPQFFANNIFVSNIWKAATPGKHNLNVVFTLSDASAFEELAALKKAIDRIERHGVSRTEFEQMKKQLGETYSGSFTASTEQEEMFKQERLATLESIQFKQFSEYLQTFDFEQYQVKRKHWRVKPPIATMSSDLKPPPVELSLKSRGLMFASPFHSFSASPLDFACSTQVVANFQIKVPAQEKNDIEFIISRMGTKSWYWLMTHKGEMKKVGNRISAPTLQFLAVILSNPKLAEYMQVIYKSSLLRKEMQKGISEGLQKQVNQGTLYPNLEGFAQYLHLDYGRLKSYVDARDWDGFAHYCVFK